MALIKYGGGIIQMSGSIAGTTHARNRYGNYARARTKPVNPKSVHQQLVRASIATLTTRWSQTLDDVKRAAWDLYGSNLAMKNRLGEVIHLTGFNHYIRSNVISLMWGHEIVDDGPVIFELPAADPLFAITASEAVQQIKLAFDVTMDWATENDAYMYWFQGSPQNAQRNFFAGPWRKLSWMEGIDPGPIVSPQNIAVAFPIAEGQHQWVYARIRRADGRLSEPFRDDTFCLAAFP